MQIGQLLVVGLTAGILSGFVGIGGGLVMVPALIWLLGYSQHQAQGTSLGVLILPVVFLAARNYYKEGMIDIKVVAIIAMIALGIVMQPRLLVGGELGRGGGSRAGWWDSWRSPEPSPAS